MPLSPPQPNPTATTTTFQVGTYNALTDTFTVVFDLNDFSSTWIHWNTIKIQAPEEIDVRGNNIRAPGERISRIQYKNGHVTCAVMVRSTTSQLVLNKIHALRQAIRNESLPYVIRFAAPGAQNYTYLDVAKCTWTPPYDPQQFNAFFQTNVVLDFEVQPGMRGDRVTLQNYCVNPGFEGPCGGLSCPAPILFQDPLTSTNAYAVQAGSAPTTTVANTYLDIVLANVSGLQRYYRLDEASGTNAWDISGSGATGTYVGSPTLGVAGGLSGDTDTCITLNGTSQYVTVPSTNLPSGNATVSLGIWFKFAANPASSQVLLALGGGGTHLYIQLLLDTSGRINADIGTSLVTSAALTTGVWHFAVATWDGTTGRLIVDGAAAGTAVTPGAQTIASGAPCRVGANGASSAGQFFAGSVDEPVIQTGVMSTTQANNIWTAGHTGATGNLSNAMSIPASTRLAFGSPNWGTVNTWQVRFRFTSGMDARFYLHRTDANNDLEVQVATDLGLFHRVAGTLHTLAAPGVTLTPGAWYWVQVTQFPTPVGSSAYVQAVLRWDNNGNPGAVVTTAGPAQTFDAVTALAGAPQMLANTNALVIGGQGNSSGLGQSVALFGPGGWSFQGDGGTGPASGAWDQLAADVIPIGTSSLVPVQSQAAARVDCPPAGTVSAYWVNAAATSTLAGLQASGAIPTSPGVQFSASVWVKSSGLGVACSQYLAVWEYSSAGALLREDLVGSTVTGSQAGWTQLTGSITTGASCAYVILVTRVQDTNAGASANGTVWWENAQLWLTANGSSMPYCELRFLTSPAQLVVSGILGDMPAACHTSLGSYLPASSGTTNTNLLFLVGQRAAPVASSVLYGKLSPAVTAPTLDTSNAFGGFFTLLSNGDGAQLQPDALVETNPATGTIGQIEATLAGTYHVFARVLSGASAGNLSKITLQTSAIEEIPHFGGSAILGPLLAPFTTSSLWNIVDLGQLTIPIGPAGNLRDLTQATLQAFATCGNSGTGAAIQTDWWALLPVDGSLLMVVVAFNGVGGSPDLFGTGWLWTYLDGLARQQSKSTTPTFNLGNGATSSGAPIPDPANAITAVASPAGIIGGIGISSAASPYLVLDPSQQVNGVSGINEFLGIVGDQNQGAWPTLPLFAEMVYSPLYNYPR